MTTDERVEIANIISRETENLERKIEELKEFIQPVEPDTAIGRISRMDAINNKSIAEASMYNLKIRLEQLTLASRILDDNDFGNCTECHRPIPFE